MKQVWGNVKKRTDEGENKQHNGVIRTTCNANWPKRETKERKACAGGKMKIWRSNYKQSVSGSMVNNT